MITRKKTDLGYVIRTAACVLAFLAATMYFAHVCGVVAENYLMLASKAAVSWSGSFVVSAVLFIIMLGVTAALIRPTWVAMATYAVAAVLYVFFVGFNIATLIAGAVLVAVLVLYLLLEVHLFSNQIKASTHPLGEKKMLICSLLAALIAVSVGVGYNNDATKRNYIIPPEARTYYSQYMMSLAKPQVDAQKATAKQKEEALKSVEKNINDTADQAEQGLKPFQKYIPILLGVFAFCFFQIVLIFAGIIAMLFVPLLFWLLKITHFTNTVSEKCEVTRLTLRSKG